MSASGDTISDYYDDEQITGIDETESYNFENYYYPEEEEGEEEDRKFLYPRWKNAPRAPEDFISSKPSVSSGRDSDYERWLEEYYKELVLRNLPSVEEQMCDTFDLIVEKGSKEFCSPIFKSRTWDPWSKSTKYWGPDEVRRHWPLRKRQREYLFYPSIYPDLNLRSRYGRFYSLLYTAAALPQIEHRSGICRIFKKILESLLVQNTKTVKILNCDNLYSLKWFDFMTKKAVMRCLCKFLRTQNQMEKVFFENACLKRLEAIVILCALSRSGGYSIKELHIWKMFEYGECPLLLNELPEKKNSLRQNKTMEFFTKIHYLQILYKFSCLTHLSVNYAYLANPEGDALLCIKSLRTGCLRELRILCLKEERPLVTNPGYGVGGYLITDGVWKKASEWCPDLRVKFVFLNLPQYEDIILFLSKSIPVSSVYISSGINFEFRNPWEIDCTLLELRNWYSNTLESLSLHLWHHRDLLDFVIKCKIIDEFPNLINFEFIGALENVDTLEQFCCRLCNGNYKLKNLLFWVEEDHTIKEKLESTRKKVASIRSYYTRRFQVADIDADIQTYRLRLESGALFRQLSLLINRLPRGNQSRYFFFDLIGQLGNETFGEAKSFIGVLKELLQRKHERKSFKSFSGRGVLGEMWSILQERLKFRCEYLKEQHTTGMLRLRNGMRDVVLHFTIFMFNSTDDFLLPVADIWHNIYFKTSPQAHSSSAFLKTWSFELWISTVSLVLVIIALLYVMLKLSSKYITDVESGCGGGENDLDDDDDDQGDNEDGRGKRNFFEKLKRVRAIDVKNLSNCFLTVIAGMLSQDICIRTKVLSIRIVIIVFLAFGIVLDTSYSGLLISQLTLASQFSPFSFVNEIPTTDLDYSLCIRPETYAYFQILSDEINFPKWEVILNKYPCPVLEDLDAKLLCQSNVAFLELPLIMERHLKNIDCQIVELTKRLFPVTGSFLVNRNLGPDIGEHFRLETIRYRETGVMSRLKKKWLLPKDWKVFGKDKHHIQISYEHVAGVVMLYLVLIVFSCFVLIVELSLSEMPNDDLAKSF